MRQIKAQQSAFSVVVSVAALLVTACADGDSSRTANSPHIDSSRAELYTSVAQLVADADLIVIAKAGVAESVPGAVPSTDTTMSVSRMLCGDPVTSFSLRQVGDAVTADSEVPVVSSGHTYLLFLDHFTTQQGRVNDTEVVVGGAAGSYVQSGNTFSKTDPLSPDLPASLSAADVPTAGRTCGVT